MPTLRERFSTLCGPGILAGITLGDWFRLLKENGFRVHLRYLPRAAIITGTAAINSTARWYDDFRYRAEIERTSIQPPLFVLGHWRSGTTHLHNLLAQDERFACPNLYEVLFPRSCLGSERIGARLFRWIAPNRRPQDNVRIDPGVGYEDEFAHCTQGFRTPYLAWVFPTRTDYYDRFLTFRDAGPEAVETWRATLRWFLKKLTLKYGRPLILKSPAHTCRIGLLLDMFPEARFVHIRRHPYAVFRSTQHMHTTVLPVFRLQRGGAADGVERVLRQYREMYDAFFEQRGLIPAGRLHEMSLEELEKDPIGETRRVYESLGLPEFGCAEPAVRRYVDSIAGYRKNQYAELPAEQRERIRAAWGRCFDEWGYEA